MSQGPYTGRISGSKVCTNVVKFKLSINKSKCQIISGLVRDVASKVCRRDLVKEFHCCQQNWVLSFSNDQTGVSIVVIYTVSKN